MRGRGKTKRKQKGIMNGLETSYSEFLDSLLSERKIVWWAYEPCALRLAPRTTYTPDFCIMLPDGEIQYHECKGFFYDSARVKIKVAAELFPHAFFVVRLATKNADITKHVWPKVTEGPFVDKRIWMDQAKRRWIYDLVPGWE